MEPFLEADKFDICQQRFLINLVEEIARTLEGVGLHGEKLAEATYGVAFGVACAIDDVSGPLTLPDGQKVSPLLVFQGDGEQLVHIGGNSYMHEYIAKAMDEVFCGPD